MRIAYFDCFSGISGDMLIGALIDAGLPLNSLRAELSKMPLGGYTLDVQRVSSPEISGAQVVVRDHSPGQNQGYKGNGNGHAAYANGPEHGYNEHAAADLTQTIGRSLLSKDIKQKANMAIDLLAKTEAPICLYGFAGVSTLVHVVGTIAGLSLLGVERVECSPLNAGDGCTWTPRGATPGSSYIAAEILPEATLPLYGTDPGRELPTPTGGAIMASIASAFGPMPLITINRLAYGLGRADGRGIPCVLRLTIGDLIQEGHTWLAAPHQSNSDEGKMLFVKPEYNSNMAMALVSEKTRRAFHPADMDSHQQIGRYRDAAVLAKVA